MSDYYKIIDLKKEPKHAPRILIAQPTWENKDWQIIDGLYFHTDETKARLFAEKILEIAKSFDVNLILFPELSIPESLVNIINAWSNQNDCIVIAGSHYYKSQNGYVARSPIIFENEIYYTEKIVPAPSEVSPFVNEGLKSGEKVLIFENTYVGRFSTLICSDYLAYGLKEKLFAEGIDILFVPAFQRNSDIYHVRMGIDCDSSQNGIYIAYANNILEQTGDGRSAFFSLMDRTFQEKFIDRVTDGNPLTKICELHANNEYIILEINLKEKKPLLGKNVHSRPNIKIINISENKSDSNSFVANNKNINLKISDLKDKMRSEIYNLVARHGLDDTNWLKALSSQLFLSQIAIDLKLTEQEEYTNLIDAFFQFFTPKHDDSLSLIESRILITPDENIRLLNCMLEEDKVDPYYTFSSKTIASNINATQLHENYLYGVALGVASSSSSNFMSVATNSAINYLMYKKNPSARDNHGGWYPYRIPWITARILISFSNIDFTQRPDVDNIKNVIDLSLESLISRLTSEGHWRSGAGSWVSKWESTALCLEAFLKADVDKRFKVVIDSIIERIIKDKSWKPIKPDFSTEDIATRTLAAVLIASVIIQLKYNYDMESNISNEVELEYLSFCSTVVTYLSNNTENMEIRQFSTIPQVISYCLALTEQK